MKRLTHLVSFFLLFVLMSQSFSIAEIADQYNSAIFNLKIYLEFYSAYFLRNRAFDVSKQNNDVFRINYITDVIEPDYLMPTVISSERYKLFTDKMSKATKKKLGANYSLYEPDTLYRRDNVAELYLLYPSIATRSLYILKSDTSDTNKARIEGYFAEAGYSEADLEIDNSLIAPKTVVDGATFNTWSTDINTIRSLESSFLELGDYQFSRFFRYYVALLVNAESGEFDLQTDMYLNYIRNEKFDNMLFETGFSSLGDSELLRRYIDARRAEYNKDYVFALNSYIDCNGFYDSLGRCMGVCEKIYQEAISLIKQETPDLEGAYSLFSMIPTYSDCTDYMKFITSLIECTPQAER